MFWFSQGLGPSSGITLRSGEAWDEASYWAPAEDMQTILDPGWSWPGEEVVPGLQLPTFTRSIPRPCPPRSPAGIAACSAEVLKIWVEDQFRFPPYTYQGQLRICPKDDACEFAELLKVAPRVLGSSGRPRQGSIIGNSH